MNIRFYNARILTMEEEIGKDGDLREIFTEIVLLV